VSDLLPTLEPESFDAVLCDPPYGLAFRGKAWDHGVPSAEVWAEVLRVLKPGGHLIAFGGTRTFHRLTCAIEDAGFEIRDCLAWLYGQGFPKSLDISKALDKEAGAEREVTGYGPPKTGAPSPALAPSEMNIPGARAVYTKPSTAAAKLWHGYGTALKPAWEPAILAMKPTVGTFAENALAWGVAGINVDGCRIIGDKGAGVWGTSNATCAPSFNGSPERHDFRSRPVEVEGQIGRWPANVALDEEAAAMLDEQSGEVGGGRFTNGGAGYDEAGLGTAYLGRFRGASTAGMPTLDKGGASRFFYVSKASRSEREAGLEGFSRIVRRITEGHGRGEINTSKGDGTGIRENRPTANHHPTVKPIRLAEWLAKLLLPPKRDTPRRLLVPFSGSGSEMIGGLLAGWDEVVGIEREAEYVEIAEARLAYWMREADAQESLFAERTA